MLHGVQCRGQPEPALYNGGILKFGNSDDPDGYRTTETGVFSPAFVVYNLNKTTMYTFSCELGRRAPFVHVLPLSSVCSRTHSAVMHVSFNNLRHRAGWVKLEGASNALITARLAPDNTGARCIGTVLARSDCWAFVKGGFVLDWPTQTAVIFFQVHIVASDELHTESSFRNQNCSLICFCSVRVCVCPER